MKLIIFVLIVWGIFAIGQSHIFSWWRECLNDCSDLPSDPKVSWIFGKLNILWNCSLCLGFWIGIFLSLLGNIFPSIDVSPLKGYENIPFNAILASGGAYIIQMVMENKFPEPEDEDDPDTNS